MSSREHKRAELAADCAPGPDSGAVESGVGQRLLIATSSGEELAGAWAWVVLQLDLRIDEDSVRARLEPLLVTDSWADADRAARRARAATDMTDAWITITRRPLLGFGADFVVHDRNVVVVYKLDSAAREIAPIAIVPSFAEALSQFRGERFLLSAPCAMRAGTRN